MLFVANLAPVVANMQSVCFANSPQKMRPVTLQGAFTQY